MKNTISIILLSIGSLTFGAEMQKQSDVDGSCDRLPLSEDEFCKDIQTLLASSIGGNHRYCILELPKLLNDKNLSFNNDGPPGSSQSTEFKETVVAYRKAGCDQYPIEYEWFGTFSCFRFNYSGLMIVTGDTPQPLPLPVAKLYADNFRSGLIARLVLGEFESSLKLPIYKLDACDGDKYPQRQAWMRFVKDYATYIRYAGYTDANQNGALLTYDAYLGCCKKEFVETGYDWVGLANGWNFGQDLLDSASTDPQFLRSAWRLIRYRNSVDELGAITGYTLSYMSGRLRVANIAASNAVDNNPRQPLANLTEDATFDARARLGNRPTNELSSAFGNLLARAALAVDGPKNQASKASLRLLLEGYLRGLSDAPGDIYDLGFSIGYRAGYEQGFHDGYADGYTAGEKAAWDQMNYMFRETGNAVNSKTMDEWLSDAQTAITIGKYLASL